MRHGRATALWLAGLAGAGAMLAGCDNAAESSPAQQVEQVQERLAGTWLREYEEAGVPVRRVLQLQADGHFVERSRAEVPGGPPTEHRHEGEWLFDGTNLKRRYTRMDGKPAGAPSMPYATFELSFPSRNDFTGVDHVHRLEVRYRRVADGTEP